MPKTCALESCGKVLKRRADEPDYNFKRRKFCNRECSNAGLVKNIGPRFCSECNAQICRRTNETKQMFLKRQTCLSPKCVSASRGRGNQRKQGFSLVKCGRVAWKPENEMRLALMYDIRQTAIEAGATGDLTGIALDIVRDEPDRVLLGGVRRAA